MKNYFIRNSIAITIGLLAVPLSQAEIMLLAVGTLDHSRAGSFADLSGLTYTLENGVSRELSRRFRVGDRLRSRQYFPCSSRPRPERGIF